MKLKKCKSLQVRDSGGEWLVVSTAQCSIINRNINVVYDWTVVTVH